MPGVDRSITVGSLPTVQSYLGSAADQVGVTDSASTVRAVQRTTTDPVGITDSVVSLILSTFPDPVGQTPGVWTGVFRDEFSGTMSVTDSANGLVNFGGPTWQAWYPDASVGDGNAHSNNPGREQEYYDYLALSVSGGVLTLTATYDHIHTGLPYTSGLICSYPTFNQTYGYFECRMKSSRVAGTWPAFWLSSTDFLWPPEIDVMEQLGTDAYYTNTTWQNAGGAGSLFGSHVTADVSAYHVYGLKWTASGMWFYLDGVQVNVDTNSADIPIKNMYVVCNLAIDGNQSFTAGAGYPTSAQVDYVRAWQ